MQTLKYKALPSLYQVLLCVQDPQKGHIVNPACYPSYPTKKGLLWSTPREINQVKQTKLTTPKKKNNEGYYLKANQGAFFLEFYSLVAKKLLAIWYHLF